jgi:DNA-binding NtrC family response regulator
MPDSPRSGIILVVDDQESVRALLRRQLTDAGHTVLEAGDGAEAIHLVRRRNGAVDLILSDVVMPLMNGTVLQKPFDPVQLAELVALALEHPISPPAARASSRELS